MASGSWISLKMAKKDKLREAEKGEERIMDNVSEGSSPENALNFSVNMRLSSICYSGSDRVTS